MRILISLLLPLCVTTSGFGKTAGKSRPSPDLWPPNSGPHFLVYPPTDPAEEAVEKAELQLLRGNYGEAEAAYHALAKRFGARELGIHVEATLEYADSGIDTYADLTRLRVEYLHCRRDAGERVSAEPGPLADKVVEAVRAADARAIASLTCEVTVGVPAACGARYSPPEVARYFVDARHAGGGKAGLLPLKVLKRVARAKRYLVALSGFQQEDREAKDLVRVVVLTRGARGWEWDEVIEVDAPGLPKLLSEQ